MGRGPGAAALPGGVADGPRPAPRLVLTWGVWQSWLRRVLPRLEQRSAGRWQRQLRECLPWRRRKETLASQGARLGPTRGTWGGAGFGPAWGRMVNLELMHTGEGEGIEF